MKIYEIGFEEIKKMAIEEMTFDDTATENKQGGVFCIQGVDVVILAESDGLGRDLTIALAVQMFKEKHGMAKSSLAPYIAFGDVTVHCHVVKNSEQLKEIKNIQKATLELYRQLKASV